MQIEGYVDEITQKHVKGWAFDAQAPEDRVEVGIYADGSLLDRVRADGFRADLKLCGKGDGRHAFHFPIPPHFASCTIEVKPAGLKSPLPRSIPVPPQPCPVRLELAEKYIKGAGIEIGALHHPTPVPAAAKVRYIDRMDTPELRRQYPELANLPLVNVDIIDDGQTLSQVADQSQDFVLANHFLEHTENPLLCLKNMLRVLRSGGILFLALPNKDFTFDIDREITPFDHVLRDYREGPAGSRLTHFKEWVTCVQRLKGAVAESRLKELLDMDYSIHFHVWDRAAMLDLLHGAQRELKLPFKIEVDRPNGYEVVFILQKM